MHESWKTRGVACNINKNVNDVNYKRLNDTYDTELFSMD